MKLGAHDTDWFISRGHKGRPFGSEEWTALIAVAHSNVIPDTQIAIARLLLSNGAGIDAADRYGVTALHAAIQSRNVELALFLIQQKAPIMAVLRRS